MERLPRAGDAAAPRALLRPPPSLLLPPAWGVARDAGGAWALLAPAPDCPAAVPVPALPCAWCCCWCWAALLGPVAAPAAVPPLPIVARAACGDC
eukprot:1137703-Pelagomonas_calceolata.AAC.2